MTVRLVLKNSRIDHLRAHLNEVKILEDQGNDYSYVEFEIKGNVDVLSVFHAGTDAGLELGLYGSEGKRVK